MKALQFRRQRISARGDPAVSTNVDLGPHAKISSVALLGVRHIHDVRHFKVTRPRVVPSRGRSVEDRRAHRHAQAKRAAFVGQMPLAISEKRLRQPVSFQRVEVQDHDPVGNEVAPQLDLSQPRRHRSTGIGGLPRFGIGTATCCDAKANQIGREPRGFQICHALKVVDPTMISLQSSPHTSSQQRICKFQSHNNPAPPRSTNSALTTARLVT